MRALCLGAVVLIGMLAGGRTASAQQSRLRPVSWSLTMMSPRRGDSGVVAVAALKARIDRGWHLFSLSQPVGGARATVISVVSDPPFRLAGTIGRPAPDTIPDRTSSGVSEIYSDSVTFRLPIGIQPPPARRYPPLVVAVTYQVCSARLCLAPRTDSVSADATGVR